ncbi:MAG: hypothetical protein JNJ82_19710 [Opitutaceae bacterium]|jgi:hypothetical protein|nr:hypothetical protein [Opitutaceae bacterium]
MNSTSLRPTSRTAVRVASLTSLLALPLALCAAPKEKAPTYENYIDFSLGSALQSGDRAGFQKDMQVKKTGFGGIDDLFFTTSLNDTTTLKLRSHVIGGNNDFLLDLQIDKEDLGYLKFGYKEYRVFYDGTGGYWPTNGFSSTTYNEELAVDRGNLWLELGYTPEDAVNFVFRYDLFTREGTKDSLSWGDTGLAISSAATRNILPSFWRIDEKRQQIVATLSKHGKQHLWNLGVRSDTGDYTNGRYERRRIGEPQDRKITHKEGQDYDLFQMRGSYENRISDQLWITTAVARTTIDTVLSGSRIYGQTFDPVYDPAYLNRQQRDEGFFDLHGESEMKQTIATLSALYRPSETVSIIPAARFEKIDWSNRLEFEETNIGAGPAFGAILDEVEADSNKEWKDSAQSIEVRYIGLKNWTLNAKIDYSRSDGDLEELRVLEPGTALQVISIDRETRFDRSIQKYQATANWYAKPGTTLAFQYYFKARQNDYRNGRDNTISTADRYPAYVSNQDFETNDLNVRLSTRLASNLRSVTRYDYQNTTIRTQDIGLAFGESAELTSHILSQSVSWNPQPRWYVQGTMNVVFDTLRTPAVLVTGAGANLVKNSDANYVNVSLSSGYALDDASDLYVDYNFYEARKSYVNNADVSVPFGSEGTSHMLSATWVRKLDARTQLTLKYAYADKNDVPYGVLSDYEAHMIYGKIQYRF